MANEVKTVFCVVNFYRSFMITNETCTFVAKLVVNYTKESHPIENMHIFRLVTHIHAILSFTEYDFWYKIKLRQVAQKLNQTLRISVMGNCRCREKINGPLRGGPSTVIRCSIHSDNKPRQRNGIPRVY